MNHIHSSIWNEQTGTYVAVCEHTRSAGKKVSSRRSASGGRLQRQALGAFVLLAGAVSAWAQPMGGTVTQGNAVIGGTPGNMIVTQTTPNVAINWQSFGVQAGESVRFVQPDSRSVALNRVTGADPSQILGSLSSNGQVFLINPNGILFGKGAAVNVGGLVASTLALSDASFMANSYRFSGAGAGSVVNQGSITSAAGGYVALLGANVSNQGVIAARLGTVALAAGNAVTLDMAGDRLLSVTVDQGAVDALVDNGGLLQADGGQVLMTTHSAGSLLANAVNNTGVVQARTIDNVQGTIVLRGGMDLGTLTVAGTLDASAPDGGNGGSIQTAAARMNIADGVAVTTAASSGNAGLWALQSQSFTVGSLPTDNISGSTLSGQLVTNNVTISTVPGNGDIHVNDAVAWTASSVPTTLTLLAGGDLNLNAPITATNGNLVACCGRDVNVNLGADITTTNGSVLLGAGRNLNLWGALTTTNGNVTMCAANDVRIGGKITLTHTTSIVPEQSLGLPLGLVLSAGYGVGAPGAGGTVVFETLAPDATVTNAPTTIYYNPVAYTSPTDYAGNIIGAAPVQHMLVFAQAQDKVADGTTTATVTTLLKGSPVGDVTLVAGPGSTANFDTPNAGINKTITMTGYSLAGADANRYALATPCCGPVVTTTTANITPVIPPVVTPPVVEPPVVIPPVVIPPVVEPPVVIPPVVVPPVVEPPVVIPPVVVPPVVIPPVVEPPVVVPPVVIPPVVTPPVVIPPVVTPPVVAPPVVIPPVVTPPVVTPPVVAPPVVIPPVVTPPVVTPPVVAPPVVIPPVVTPPVVIPPETMPPVVPVLENPLPPVWTPATPPVIVPSGYVFTMPAPVPVPRNVLAFEAPPAPQAAPAPVVVVKPSVPYQAPVRKPKPERN
ncbi:MAG: filamentous hemagglutinin N-terminal domain-containing protein [Comamonas sp.]